MNKHITYASEKMMQQIHVAQVVATFDYYAETVSVWLLILLLDKGLNKHWHDITFKFG